VRGRHDKAGQTSVLSKRTLNRLSLRAPHPSCHPEEARRADEGSGRGPPFHPPRSLGPSGGADLGITPQCERGAANAAALPIATCRKVSLFLTREMDPALGHPHSICEASAFPITPPLSPARREQNARTPALANLGMVEEGKPAMWVFASIRTVVYMTGFVVVWAWLALAVHRLDPAIGVTMPVWVRQLGFVLLAAGGVLALTCGFLFATKGRGTPAPFDAPREVVAVGPYRYVRNPMYIGGLLVLAGFGLIERSLSILVLTVGAAVLAHLFVVVVEEPRLEWKFGDGYRRYRRSVNRWLPRLR
jgi:protein-S-isoprenylcysteine O-methyltransferase Ste14